MTTPPPKLHYHREYLDPSVAPFGERHLQELRYLHSTGVRDFNKVVTTNRYTALLKISGDHLHVLLLGKGQLYFEFMTSGFPLRFWTFTQGSITGQAYYTGVVGVSTRKGVLTPVLRTGERVQHTALGASRVLRGNQVILLDEPVHYYSASPVTTKAQAYPRQLYDAWAPLNSHTGVHFRSYHAFFQVITFHTLLGSYAAHYLRDIGYDVVWSDNKNFDPLREAALTSTPTDWPRKTGVRLVQHATLGAREFAIYVDAFDQVSVFPTAKIVSPLTAAGGAPIQNVDPMYIKMARVTFPSWAYKKTQTFKSWYTAHSASPGDIATGVYEFPEIDWQLHPDGNKMCAIVYEHIEALLDTAYYAPYATDITTQGPGTFWPNAASFGVMNETVMGTASIHGGLQASGATFHQNAPGLLQVLIEVEITGPNPEDFSLSLTTEELRRPTTSSYCPMFAGYVWHDVRAVNWTKPSPQYDARRGDLCVLDIECWGNTTTNKAANLFSLKNLHAGSGAWNEIRTFHGGSAFAGALQFSGVTSVVACDMRTLSFVFKFRNDVRTTDTYPKIETPFGIGVFVMNRWQQTFLPGTMPQVQKDAITSRVNTDARAAMDAELPGLTLMPLNDLRDWTDPDLAALRERYTRALTKAVAQTYGVYAGNPTPYLNAEIADFGYKYWKTGSYALTPTTAAQNWYNTVVRHGLLKPYVLFDLQVPRPGWWQHTGQLVQRLEVNPHHTFFTHPNNSWAFFSQDFIYNSNGIHIVPLGNAGLGTTEWDATKMEHCIFDQVNVATGRGTTTVSSFRELYNKAIRDGKNAGKITDDSAEIALADMKIAFVPGTIADPYDPTITYAQMRINWPAGYSAYYRELGYFSGSKVASYDVRMLGGALDLSLSALWKKTSPDSSLLTAPCSAHMPATFSTCLLITK